MRIESRARASRALLAMVAVVALARPSALVPVAVVLVGAIFVGATGGMAFYLFPNVTEAVERFQIRGGGIRGTAGHLSGGNLQKLILARELSRRPDLLIAEQPTQGLDVQATEDVWQALLRQRETSAVLMVTGDLKEALSLSDRIAVMFRGRILGIVSAHDTADIDRIKLLMAGIEAH